MAFSSALSIHPPAAHLVASGELDAFSGFGLRRRVVEAIEGDCVSLTVDVSGVTFVDASGLGALVQLSQAVTAVGGTVSITAASPRFLSVVEVAGLRTVLT